MKFLFVLLMLPTLAFGQAFTMNDIPFMAQGSSWAARVVANGGAMPSASTIACMENLRLTLISQGLTNKLISLCVFVPDSLIAATTPLIFHAGSGLWTNNGPFVSGDLNISGLLGDGISKCLDTGILGTQAVDPNSGSCGLTLLIGDTSTNGTGATMGIRNSPAAGALILAMHVSQGGAPGSAFYPRLVSSTLGVLTNDLSRVGYVSGNVLTNNTVATNTVLYVASPLESHKLLAISASHNSGGVIPPTNTLSVFAWKLTGTNTDFAPVRLSVAAVHYGYSQTESSNLWWALKTCRECLGGGSGDPVHEWNRRIVAAGGANISTTTSNASRTFLSGLDTDSLLYKMVMVNPYHPSGLTAARTPIIWRAGHSTWTNVAFGETNLTVNGLTGNGTTKYLGTGIVPNVVNIGGFTDTSAGLSVLMYNVPADANMFNVGVSGSAANSIFAIGNQVGNLVFYCWIFTTVNTDFVTRAEPSDGWEGYLSGNRTAANAIRLDWVTNQVHNVATNATGATASNNNTLTNLFAHALAGGNSSPANFSDQTVSFLAVHSGLTQTESSNFWWGVAKPANHPSRGSRPTATVLQPMKTLGHGSVRR